MLVERRVSKVRLEELVDHVVTPGIWTRPPKSAPNAEHRHRHRIGHSRSAMWCSAPGKPTSVSSGSPLAGFFGSAWARWPCSSSRASSHGSPQTTRKTIRNA